jgi:hydrogenase maturation protease
VNAALVIGVGNVDRGDDAAGRRVAGILLRRGLRGTDVVEATGEGTALFWLWRGYRRVYLVDAVVSGSPPGTIHHHDAARGPLPARLRSSSSHAFGVAEAVELARSLGELPPSIVVYAIEGREFGLGAHPTEEVLRACDGVADRIAAEEGGT